MRPPCILALLAGGFAGPAAAELRICLPAPWTAEEGDAAAEVAVLMASLAPALDRFPEIGKALARLRPEVCLVSPLRGMVGWLDPGPPRITLRADAPEGLLRGVLLHELRHLDQFARGFCPDNVLTMREGARATFALEADASAVSLAMAWVLRDAGDTAPWQALAAWPEQADIAAVFAATLEASGDMAAAAAAAFAQWYEGPNLRESYYLAACGDYLDREDIGHLLPGRARLDREFLDRVCRLPDGLPFPCAEPAGPLR